MQVKMLIIMQFSAMWGDDCHVVCCLRMLIFRGGQLFFMAASLPRSVQGHTIGGLLWK